MSDLLHWMGPRFRLILLCRFTQSRLRDIAFIAIYYIPVNAIIAINAWYIGRENVSLKQDDRVRSGWVGSCTPSSRESEGG